MRNVWSYSIIFCGHFPDQTYTFSEEEVAEETRGGFYVRQLLGAANIDGSAAVPPARGNLSFQVEHHLFPDMPSSRYAEIAPRVRDICRRYGLPYNTGPLHRQLGTVHRTILRLAFPGGRVRPKPERVSAQGSTRVRHRWAARGGRQLAAGVGLARMPRIPYRDPDSAPEPIREVIAETPLALLRIVAHADTAFEPWLRYSNALLRRLELDPLLRELAILQVARLSASEYEWAQHVPIAESFGASEEAIAAIEAGRDEDSSLAEEHRAILSFTREVVADGAAGWRGETLARIRSLIKQAVPAVTEEWKWRGVPVWYHDGMICTGETYKARRQGDVRQGRRAGGSVEALQLQPRGQRQTRHRPARSRHARRRRLQGAHPRRGRAEQAGEPGEVTDLTYFTSVERMACSSRRRFGVGFG